MIEVKLDLSALTAIAEALDPEVLKKAAQESVSLLAAATHAHIIEQANAKLHSRLQPYLNGLKIQEDDGVWVITLDKGVRWIDDGMDPHSMVEDLLSERQGSKGKVHTSKEGHRWRVIPFNHGPGKGPTTTTPAQQSLIATIKSELKSRKVPFGKLENDDQGKPKIGLLHSFDINDAPAKTHHGPGQGWGRIGDVKQGPTGIPFLRGVRIYQHTVKNNKGEEHVKRSIMTFRIVSSKMAGTGRWWHPGLPPEHLFEEAHDWAKREWEQNVIPKLIAGLSIG